MVRRRVPRRIRGPGLPWKSFFALVGGLFLLIVVFGVGLDFVSDRVSLRAALIAREQSVLLDEVTQLEERNGHLSERVAVLERAKQIDQEAQLQVQRAYEAGQKEIKRLNAELDFYQAVIDPEKHKTGVFVYKVAINPTDVADEYHYQIVLSQSPKKRYRTAKGVINFYLDGIIKGKSQRLSLSEISIGEASKLNYSFKYFQAMEGGIRLPEGFLPYQVVLTGSGHAANNPGLDYKQKWSPVTGLANKGD